MNTTDNVKGNEILVSGRRREEMELKYLCFGVCVYIEFH